MLSNKIKLTLALAVSFLCTLPVKSMEYTEDCPIQEQQLSSLEIVPNEVLLLILQYKIQNIINNHDTAQAKEEFKIFLSALRSVNQRFYGFSEEVKKYFLFHKKREVSDVSFTRTELRFKVSAKEYIIEDEESALNIFP